MNLFLFTTGTSANFQNDAVISGNSEKLSTTLTSISTYIPSTNEKANTANLQTVSFLDKPEIVSTKTREEIDKENAQKALEEKRRLAALRTVVTRSRSTSTSNVEDKTATIQVEPRTSNTYWYGFCTWYVANKRTDVPNNWGNAKAWYNSASRSGWQVGDSPRAGAVVVTRESWAGHVGYVEEVSGDTFTISEMNFRGWARVSTRTLDANDKVIIGFIY
jgi:surface antigen